MSTRAQRKYERTIALLDRLLAIDTDPVVRAHIVKMRGRVVAPMSEILAKVPGESIKGKAATLGITRQAWYGWLAGTSRPNLKRAKQLAQLTGYSIEEIRGQAERLRRRPRRATATADAPAA